MLGKEEARVIQGAVEVFEIPVDVNYNRPVFGQIAFKSILSRLFAWYVEIFVAAVENEIESIVLLLVFLLFGFDIR